MRIKSLMVVAVLATAVLCFGGFVKAQVTDNSALIAQLQAQVQALLAQIAQLQGQQGGNPSTWCHTFNTYLAVGMGAGDNGGPSAEVTNLQLALKNSGYDLSGDDQGTFGDSTAAAVVQFQRKYKIRQTGTVGPLTRAKLNALYGCGKTPDTNQAITAAIANDNPASGQIASGQQAADLLNFYFTGTGTVTSVTLRASILSEQNIFPNVYLYDGNTPITSGYMFNANGQIVINGLSIPVTPESHEYSVRADVDPQANANIGVSLVGYTINNATAVTTNIQGNTMTIGTPSPSQPTITITSPAGGENWQLASSIANSIYTINFKSSGFTQNDKATAYLQFSDGTMCELGDFLIYYLNNTSFNIYNGMQCPNISRTVTYGNGYKIGIFVGDSSNSDLGKAHTYSNAFNLVPLSITQPSVTVTSLNDAGLGFPQGQVVNITWTSKNLSPNGKFYIGLTDDKNRSGTIASNIPATQNSYAWTVAVPMMGYGNSNDKYKTFGAISNPGVDLGNFKVQVSYNANTGNSIDNAGDTNDNYFKIYDASNNQASITVTSPVGGETWNFGENHEIDWTYSPLPPNDFQIQLISDNGTRWGIRSFGEGSTYYQGSTNDPYNYNKFHINWKVGYNNQGAPLGNFPPGRYKVEVSNRANDGSVAIAGSSANYFTVGPTTPQASITVTKPTTTDVYAVGAKGINYSWSANYNVANQQIPISVLDPQDGVIFTYNSSYNVNLPAGTYTPGSAGGFTMPEGLGAGKYRLKICDTIQNVCGYSTYFNVGSNSPSIVITSPKGGTYTVGQTVNVTWTSQNLNSTSGKLLLGYSSLNQYFKNIATVPSTSNSYSWTIPNDLPGTDKNFSIQLQCYDCAGGPNNMVFGSSTPYFQITPSSAQPTITVTSPYTGSTVQTGQKVVINWTPDKNSSNISKIYIKLRKGTDTYRGDEGAVSNLLADNVGSFLWPVPTTLPSGSDYSIRVIAADGTSFGDSGYFNIAGPVVQCANLYWIDNTTQDCQPQKMFCGTYMYPGLQTFDNQTICQITVLQKLLNQLSINGVSGPTNLSVGQSGTWTINTSGSTTNLSYSVVWGDEPAAPSMNAATGGAGGYMQTATFTHTYTGPGTYSPRFYIKDNSGQTAQTSISVNVSQSDLGLQNTQSNLASISDTFKKIMQELQLLTGK